MGRYRRKREAKARRRPLEFSKKLAAWAVPVSYTHLTLPTIA